MGGVEQEIDEVVPPRARVLPVTHGAGDEVAQKPGRGIFHHADIEGVHEMPERREVRYQLQAAGDAPPEDCLGVFCGWNLEVMTYNNLMIILYVQISKY